MLISEMKGDNIKDESAHHHQGRASLPRIVCGFLVGGVGGVGESLPALV